MSEIIEVSFVHPDLGAGVYSAGKYMDNRYQVDALPDERLSVVIKKSEGVLKRIEALRLELIKTSIPAKFTFELDNGDSIRGLISEIKITHVRKHSVRLELFGGKFGKIIK